MENVQADATINISNDVVKKVSEDVQKAMPFVAEGEGIAVVKGDIENAAATALKSEFKDYTITVTVDPTVKVVKKSIPVVVTFKDTQNTLVATETISLSLDKKVVSTDDIAMAWAETPVFDVNSITVANGTSKADVEKNAKAAFKDVTGDSLDAFVTNEYGKNFNSASFDLGNIAAEYDEEKQTCKVTFPLTSYQGRSTEAKITKELAVNLKDSQADKILAALDGFDTVKSDKFTQTDIDQIVRAGGDVTNQDINGAVAEAAMEYVSDKGVNPGTISVDTKTTPKCDSNNIWTGKLLINDGSVTLEKTISVKLVPSETGIAKVTVDLDKMTDKEIIVKSKMDGTVESPIKSVNDIDYTGAAIKVYLKDSASPLVFKGKKGGFEDADSNNKFADYFNMTVNNYQNKLGTYNIVLTLKEDSTQQYYIPVTVNTTNKEAIGKKDLGVLGDAKIAKIDAPEEVNIKLDKNAEAIAAENLVVSKAGTYELSTTSTSGTVTKSTLTVKEDGSMKLKKAVVTDSINLENTTDTFGFVVKADDTITSNDEDIAVGSVETVNGKSVLKIKTNGDGGTATLTITGGEKDKLKATVDVTVAEDGSISSIKVNPQGVDGSKSGLTKDLEAKLKGTTFVDGDDVVKVAGLTEKDKLHINWGETEDYVPVTDAKSITYDNDQVIIEYKTGEKFVVSVNQNIVVIDNNVDTLGLVGVKAEVKAKGDHASSNIASAVELRDGKIIIKATKNETTDLYNIVTVTDAYGNTATLDYLVWGGGIYKAPGQSKGVNITKFTTQVTVSNLDKIKDEYYIGEDLDTTGVTVTYTDADKQVHTIALTPDMVSGFDSKKSVNDQKLTVKFGGATETVNVDILPRELEIKNTSVGMAADEKFSSIEEINDADKVDVTTKDYGRKLVIKATEVDANASILVTTNKNNKFTVNLIVDKEGNITYDYFTYGKVIDVKNDINTLGLVAKNVTVISGDKNVTAAITGSQITIKGVAKGSATIAAVDENGHQANIYVSVDSYGNVKVDSIDKYKDYVPGWHAAENGGWYWVNEDGSIMQDGWLEDGGYRYYIVDGVTVYNSWKYFEEEGVWRYFNKWGANVENGWYWVGKFCYFFRDGKMVENEWIKTNGIWSYVDKYGHALQNGWFKIDGYYYCFDKYGNMYADTYVGKYYVNKWGAWDSRYDKK